jgi:hypothetical protein
VEQRTFLVRINDWIGWDKFARQGLRCGINLELGNVSSHRQGQG